MADRMTFVFFPEAAFGPTNNCVGIGNVLRERGHRVVFAAEESYEGTLEPLGFEERLVSLAEPPEEDQEVGQFWKDFIRETSPEFRKPTIEQLDTFIKPTWQALLDGARYCESQIAGIFEDVRPDVIVEDNVLTFPAVQTFGAPWVTDRQLQSARAEGSEACSGVLGIPGVGHVGMGRVQGRVRQDPPSDVVRIQRLVSATGHRAATRSRIHPRVAAPEHVSVPGRHGLYPPDATGRHLAPSGELCTHHRRGVPGSSRDRRATVLSCICRSGASGRRTSIS